MTFYQQIDFIAIWFDAKGQARTTLQWSRIKEGDHLNDDRLVMNSIVRP